MLYPDLGAFEKWNEKAQILNSLFSSNSQKVRSLSPLGESTHSWIEVRGVGSEVFPKIQNHFPPTLQSMLELNPA
jgi:hypothetical protein